MQEADKLGAVQREQIFLWRELQGALRDKERLDEMYNAVGGVDVWCSDLRATDRNLVAGYLDVEFVAVDRRVFGSSVTRHVWHNIHTHTSRWS